MFDADKKRFVEECYPQSEKSRKWILSTLSLMQHYEEKWGMDFTLQDFNPLQDAFNEVTTITYSGAKTILIRFRKYAKWRKESGLPCTDNVFKLETDRSKAMQDSMVSSPEHLASVLDVVFDDPVLGTIDVIYRVFLWMGFAGMDDVDAVMVTRDEVDFERMVISHSGSEYPIYRESKYDFRIACDIPCFIEGKKHRQRMDGTEIMRGKDGKRAISPDKALKSTIRPTLARKFKVATQNNNDSDDPIDIGLNLSYSRVQLSGVFYRLYQKELRGIQPDFSDYAREEFRRAENSDKPYMISEKNPKAAILLRIKKSTESDYNNWKAAFYP